MSDINGIFFTKIYVSSVRGKILQQSTFRLCGFCRPRLLSSDFKFLIIGVPRFWSVHPIYQLYCLSSQGMCIYFWAPSLALEVNGEAQRQVLSLPGIRDSSWNIKARVYDFLTQKDDGGGSSFFWHLYPKVIFRKEILSFLIQS